jgi:hypothetical protein
MDGSIRGVRPEEFAMARELRWWLVATLAVCGGIALAYVPPRGVRGGRAEERVTRLTAARTRVQALEWQWRAAHLAVRFADYRQRLAAPLAELRATNRPGPALLIDGPDPVPPAIRLGIALALDSAWRRRGLGVTKVSVAVVFDLGRRTTARAATPKAEAARAYLLPDSTDRTTCVAVVAAPHLARYLAPRPDTKAFFAQWRYIGNFYGPCAFYAAFGAPGNTVRHWLGRRNFDLAGYPDWGHEVTFGPTDWLQNAAAKHYSWFWAEVYRSVSPAGVACLGGRIDRCRDAVLDGADDASDDSLPRIVATTFSWREQTRLLEGYRYLSDVTADVGHDRFLRFWNSSLAVDTALATALKMPVGAWTERWQRRFGVRLTLGAAPPLGAALLGLLLAAAAVASVLVSVARREVR